MRIQIFSDLHFDVHAIKPITIVDGVDAVVVAGDTCEGALKAFQTLRRIVPETLPVIMVMGNHEYYRRFVGQELLLASVRAGDFNIHLLENDAVVIDGVRFLGATLWTDYCLFGNANIAAAMEIARHGLNDHRLIGWNKQPWQRFRPKEAQLVHIHSRSYIRAALATPFGGPTVVVTHHGIHWNSVPPLLRDDRLSAAYVSDLSDLINAYQPTLWVHGHVHCSFDYRVGATRIVCNPHGYGSENPQFNASLAIEVSS